MTWWYNTLKKILNTYATTTKLNDFNSAQYGTFKVRAAHLFTHYPQKALIAIIQFSGAHI